MALVRFVKFAKEANFCVKSAWQRARKSSNFI